MGESQNAEHVQTCFKELLGQTEKCQTHEE